MDTEEVETPKEQTKKVASKRLGKKTVKAKVAKGKKGGLSASLGVTIGVSKNTEVREKRVIPERVKKVTPSRDKSLSELEKLGYVSAGSASQKAKDVFVLGGEIGKFL